ncbi:MAG: alpha/beta fold hydrolase [Cyanobacteria bacterium P01_A01_bin.83]
MNQVDTFITKLASLKIQLWLDGERLRYKAPPGAMTPEIVAELKQNKAAIISFLQDVYLDADSAVAPIQTVPRIEHLPLSLSQETLWLQHQLEPQNPINNMPYVYRFQGKLDLGLLEQSQNEIIRRHEILRSTFPVVDGKPVQKIAPALTLPISMIDLQQIAPSAIEAEARLVANRESRIPFDLTTGALLRITLLQLQENDFIAIINIHRIACDGTSAGILFRELIDVYRAFVAGKPSPLSELPIQYVDFASWERRQHDETSLKSELACWKKQLGTNISNLNLPTDYLRPPRTTFKGARQYVMLPTQLNLALNNLSRESDSTLFMVLIAALNVLLYRYTDSDDVTINYSHSGRTQVELERLIGYFTKTLPVRTHFPQQISFRDLLAEIRKSVLWANEHYNIPFGELIQEFKSFPERSPLLQVLFALNPPWKGENSLSSIELDELTITSLFGYVYMGQTKFDLSLVMRETDLGLRTVLEYNQEIFAESTIVRMLEHWQILLESIAANPDLPIAKLPLLTLREQKLLQEFNSASNVTPDKKAVHRVFEELVRQHPQVMAISSDREQLTYQELNQRANQLAHYLQSLDFKSGSYVGIYFPRSSEAIISFLGVLKAGGICVPLNPQESAEELAQILENTSLTIILTQEDLPSEISVATSCKVIDWHDAQELISEQSKDDLAVEIQPDSLAYVLYEPRQDRQLLGVKLPHQAIAQNFQDAPYLNCQLGTQMLQFSPYDSNLALLEIWGTLLNGSSLIILPSIIKGSETLADFIRQSDIFCLLLPARLFNCLAYQHPGSLQSIEQILIVGEGLSKSIVKQFLQQENAAQLIYLYTLAENTAATAYAPLVEDSNFSLGKPVSNTTIHVLDRHLNPVPMGVVGNLYIGGDNLASGYSNKQKLTEQYFISNHFSQKSQARLFKTRDLARFCSDGTLEFRGPIDNQVKIRGFRIELGEIETVLTQHPDISETVVIVREDIPGDKRLIAYVVPRQEQPHSSNLRSFLKELLPNYMVPSAFVFLNTMPLTPNGKIDRRALPVPDHSNQETSNTFVVPQDKLESHLIQIWSQVLNIKPIGVRDNFFELGGNSLQAVSLFAQIEKQFGKKLPLATLFQSGTVAEIAQIIRQEKWLAPWSSLVPIQPNGSKPPLFYIHGGGGNLLVYRDLAYSLGLDQPVYGLQPRGLDGTYAPFNQIEDMAAYYLAQIRKLQPSGPYFLAGLSSGGATAWEIAQILQSQGEKVALLALFDTYGPNCRQLLPPLPRLLSVFKSIISNLLNRLILLPRKLVFKLKHLKTKQTSTKVLENLGIIKKVLSEDQKINREKMQRNFNVRLAKYKSNTSNISFWERWINSLAIFLLKHFARGYYTNAFVGGLANSYITDDMSEIPEALQQVQKANIEANRNYTPCVYSGKVTLFQASERPPGFYFDPQLGWGDLAAGGMEVYEIPGNHTSIMKSPILAEKLGVCLDKAQVNREQSKLAV